MTMTTLPVPMLRSDGREDRGGPAQPLLAVRDLKKHFPVRGSPLAREKKFVHAVDGIDFQIRNVIHGLFTQPLLANSATLLSRAFASLSEVVGRLSAKYAARLDSNKPDNRRDPRFGGGTSGSPPPPPPPLPSTDN